MNESEWKVRCGTQYDGSPVIIWTEIYSDGVYLTRRIIYFSLRKALVLRSRSGAYDTHVWLTIDDLLREPYITDEIRSYIAQLQN